MLVLTRKPGEKIFIGDNVSLTVVEVKGDSVRIAVDAPREVKIYRGEIYEAIIAENKAASHCRGHEATGWPEKIEIEIIECNSKLTENVREI